MVNASLSISHNLLKLSSKAQRRQESNMLTSNRSQVNIDSLISFFTKNIATEVTNKVDFFYEPSELLIGSKTFRMKNAVPFRIVYYEGESYISNDELGIYLYIGENINPLDELRQELIFVLEEYGLEEDELLTKDAIELKHSINRYFSEVHNG